jgi:DNA-binding response OmpR family regulator
MPISWQLDLLRPALLIADVALLSPKASSIKAIQLSITALNAKVLALSAHPDSVLSAMAHHDSLHKPIDPKMLLEKVRQLMVPVL